jgi:hypothetical protein
MDLLQGFSKFCHSCSEKSAVLISFSYFGSEEWFLLMKQINHSCFILRENESVSVCSYYQLRTQYGPKEGEESYAEHHVAYPCFCSWWFNKDWDPVVCARFIVYSLQLLRDLSKGSILNNLLHPVLIAPRQRWRGCQPDDRRSEPWHVSIVLLLFYIHFWIDTCKMSWYQS